MNYPIKKAYTRKKLFELKHKLGSKIFPTALLISTEKISWLGININFLMGRAFQAGLHIKAIDPIDLSEEKEVKLSLGQLDLNTFQYSGVPLLPCIEYSCCVELEIMPKELDLENPNHFEIIKKWAIRAINFIEYLLQEVEKNRPIIILYLQGYFFDAAIARQIAIQKGIKYLALEMTFYHKRLTWDSLSGISVNKTLAKNYYWKYQKLTPLSSTEKWYQHFFSNYKASKHLDHISSDKVFKLNEKKNIIIFLGQVYSDSSSLFGIHKGFRDQVDVISSLIEYSQKNNCFLFVKLHPKEKAGIDPVQKLPIRQLTWRKLCEQNITSQEGLVFIDSENEYDTYSTIKSSDAVVTINSQSGIESLMEGKECILCGDGFYGGLGITFDANSKKTLWSSLDEILFEKIKRNDADMLKEFLYIYFEKYCIDKSEQAIVKKLKQIVGNY